jgi:hypothetical protein
MAVLQDKMEYITMKALPYHHGNSSDFPETTSAPTSKSGTKSNCHLPWIHYEAEPPGCNNEKSGVVKVWAISLFE